MRDLVSNVAVAATIDPAVQAATIKGAAVSVEDCGSAFATVQTGAIVSAGDFTAKLQESDTTTDGDFADVASKFLIGAFPASLVAASIVKVGYVGEKAFVRVVLTKNGGTSIAASANIAKGNLRVRPAA
jgi:hypothetical protein